MTPACSTVLPPPPPPPPPAPRQLLPFVVVPLLAAFPGLLVYVAIDDSPIHDTVFDDTILEQTSDAVTGDR